MEEIKQNVAIEDLKQDTKLMLLFDYVSTLSIFGSLSGVGFSFIFVWLLMAIVTTLFVVGGNVEKMVCEPLANRQLFKVLNTNSLPS